MFTTSTHSCILPTSLIKQSIFLISILNYAFLTHFNCKLLKHKNVIATPHIAGVTRDSRNKMSEFVAKQLLTIMGGGIAERPVNPSVLEVFKNKLKNIDN